MLWQFLLPPPLTCIKQAADKGTLSVSCQKAFWEMEEMKSDMIADGTGWGREGTLKQSEERTRTSRSEAKKYTRMETLETKIEHCWWRQEVQHTFHTQRLEWTLVMCTRGGKEEEEEEESGLPQWVMPAWNSCPNASPSPTCLPPATTSAQVYLAPNFRGLQHRGKVGRDCLTELIRCLWLCESKLQYVLQC